MYSCYVRFLNGTCEAQSIHGGGARPDKLLMLFYCPQSGHFLRLIEDCVSISTKCLTFDHKLSLIMQQNYQPNLRLVSGRVAGWFSH